MAYAVMAYTGMTAFSPRASGGPPPWVLLEAHAPSACASGCLPAHVQTHIFDHHHPYYSCLSACPDTFLNTRPSTCPSTRLKRRDNVGAGRDNVGAGRDNVGSGKRGRRDEDPVRR